MKSLVALFASFLILLVPSLWAQEALQAGGPRATRIEVVGNEVTSADLILREMEIKSGMVVTPEALEVDRLRILSLGLFNNVEITPLPEGSGVALRVQVNERFYLYPYPILRYDPSLPQRRVYGVSLNDDNFQGIGDRLSAAWWDGYENGVYLQQLDPWFSIGGKYGYNLLLYTNRVTKHLSNGAAYRNRQDLFALDISRRLDRGRSMTLRSSWEERWSPLDYFTLTPGLHDQLFGLRLYYQSEQRDYRYYATRGYYFLMILGGNWVVAEQHFFSLQRFELDVYRKWLGIIWAGRAGGFFSQKELPAYYQNELSQREVRSREPLGVPGRRHISGSLEARFNIVPMQRISLPSIPIIGHYLIKMKFSTEGVVFLDRASLLQDGDTSYRDFTAYGAGLQFQLPFIEVGRAMIGWGRHDSIRHPTFILDTGVSF